MKSIILLSTLGIVAMVSEIFGFKKYIWAIVVVALSAIFLVNISEWGLAQRFFNDMIFIDEYAVAFTGLLLASAILWFVVSKDQYERGEFNIADHYALIIFSLVGAVALTSFSDLSMLFLGVEILSIPMYILAGSRKKDLASNEAALKYFMLGAFATGIMLFGIAFLYGATGSFNLDLIAEYVAEVNDLPVLFYIGVLLILIGLCFKVGVAPFHFWVPDVYEGAPILITAYMATIVKVAAFAAFFRLFSVCFQTITDDWGVTLSIIISLTVIIGNVLAIRQDSLKRMLAYSGIAQAGYLFLTILVMNDTTTNALLLYSASYTLSTLSAFAVVYWVVRSKGNDSFTSFNSLSKTNPFLAFVLAVSMLSLAGIPPTAGFFAKFYLFTAVMEEGYYLPVFVSIIGSIVSVYYYFKVIINMYAREGESFVIESGFLSRTALIVLIALILFIGVLPGFFLNMITN